jgi:transcriptional regulator with XRE-family HTH domain
MQGSRRTTIIVVGGALAIASVGYGLGTQSDDGTAVAGDEQRSGAAAGPGGPPRFFEGGQPPGFTELADKLGVDADTLARAMRDFHDRQDAERRDEFANAIADALGVSSDRVRSAFEKLRENREQGFARRLADALGADAGDVKAALDELRDDGPLRFGEFAAKLADELGRDEADVRAALEAIRPHFPGRHGHRALPLRQLSSALGVSRADLRRGFRELRRGAESERKRHDRELARFLADRFGLEVGKVADALAATAPPLSSPHPPPGLPHDSRAL